MTTQPHTPPGIPGAHGIAAVLEQIRTQVNELTETLFAARTAEELMDGIAAVEALKTTLDGLELGMVHELELTHGVKPSGWASTQDYVTAAAGEHRGHGPAVVRLAAAVQEPNLAPVGEAIRDGWLSTTKAQIITRAIDHLPGDPDLRRHGVQVLLEEAKSLDATELRKATRHLICVVDPDGQARRDEQAVVREERAAHLERDLTIRFDGAGGASIKGHFSSEDGVKLRATLLPLARPAPSHGPLCDPGTCEIPGCGHDGRDPRDHGARMHDALMELCDRAAAVDLLPESHGATPRVSVTIDLESLQTETGFGTTETGEELTAGTIRRMACDADLIPVVLGTASEVLDVGRHQRLATAALWKALVARDHHCRFPHCTRPPVMCHAHHIHHWAEGGDTNLTNMILLCSHHHRLIHAGPWQIGRTGPHTFRFDPPPGVRRLSSTGREPPDG